ncbi:MAG: terminase small subunit [Pseudomonadota bacterium]
MNKAQIAEHFGIALTTLDHWIRRGCPVISRGGRGLDWDLDADEVESWRAGRDGVTTGAGRGPSPMESAGFIMGSVALIALRAVGLKPEQTDAALSKLGEDQGFQEIKRSLAGLLASIENRRNR